MSLPSGQTRIESNTSVVQSEDSVKVGEVTPGVPGEKAGCIQYWCRLNNTLHRKTLVSNGVMDLRVVDAWTGRVTIAGKNSVRICLGERMGEFQR